MSDTLPRDNLVRAMSPAISDMRMSTDGPPRLTGHFARYNEWNQIDSVVEGRFLERVAPGAYAESLAAHPPKMQFNHGKDPEIGDKLIAIPRSVADDDIGPVYDGDVLDGLPELLLSGLRAGLYGSSYRFSVVSEDVVRKPARSDHNPDGITERTITKANVYEVGPVTWPADAGAGPAFVRSLTDEYRASTPDPAPAAAPAIPSVAAPAARKEAPVDQYVTRDDKAARVVELKAGISRRAIEYPGVFPPDVEAIDKAENDEHDALERDIAAWDARQARLASWSQEAPPQARERTYAPTVVRTTDPFDIGAIRNETRTRDEYDTKIRENALRAIDGGRFPKTANIDALRDTITDADEGENGEKGEVARRVLLTGSPAYRRAWTKYVKFQQALWSPEEARAAALAVTGTTTTGGYAIPYSFDPTLIHIGAYTAQNPYRQACTVKTITNGNNYLAVTVGAVTSTFADEAAPMTEQGPTFGQPSFTVQRMQSYATLSYETLQDRGDITSELASVFAESKATLEENKFTLGAGTGNLPFGMFANAAYTNQDTATNDVTALVDLQTLEGALPLRFRANGAFFMARSTLRQLQALDTTYRYFSGGNVQFPGMGGTYIGDVQPTGNTGVKLLGYPVWEVPSAVSTLTTDSAIIVVFCDPKSYYIIDRLGMEVEVVQNILDATTGLPTGQRGVVAFSRLTARPLIADAGRSLSVQ